jgi:hypothetical protein
MSIFGVRGKWQNRSMRGLALLVAGVCFAATQEMTLTVDKLVKFIQSAVQLKQPDKQVAEYLHHIKLSNRLDDITIEDLQGMGAGPKTVAALKELRETSAALPAPPPPPPKQEAFQIPPPDSIEQGKILSDVREYAMNYTKQMPNYLCVQVTRRDVDPRGGDSWYHIDTITTRLSYFEGHEDYKVVLVNNQPINDLPLSKLGGTVSEGEFVTMMKDIFSPESETRFEWERWATLRGKRNYVFSYDIDQSHSRYHIIADRSLDIVPPYRGLIYIDKETNMITRLTLNAYDIPITFPVRDVKTVLDYDFTKIGDSDYMLPLHAQVIAHRASEATRNDVEFRLYRKFGTDTTIKFDTPDQLPEDTVKEKPPEK